MDVVVVASSSDPPKTPIVSIPRVDLATQRPETTLLMELAGISEEVQKLLWFRDDIPSLLVNGPAEKDAIDLTLVDHNRWIIDDKDDVCNKYPWRVVEIRDHHLDEGYHMDTCSTRVIAFADSKATVASTGTLVVERLASLNTSSQQKYCPADVALLLLGVILLDSVNMSPAAASKTQSIW